MGVEEFVGKLLALLIAFVIGMMNAGYALNPGEPFLFLTGYALPWVLSLLVAGPALGAALCAAAHLLLGPLTRAAARWAVLVGVFLAAISLYACAFVFAEVPGAPFWSQNIYAAGVAGWLMYIAMPFPRFPSSVYQPPRSGSSPPQPASKAPASDEALGRTNESTLTEFVNALLRAMLKASGTELHLAAGTPPSVRVNGALVALANVPLEPEHTRAIAFELMSGTEAAEFRARRECQFSIAPSGIGDFFVRVFFDRRAIAIEIRKRESHFHSQDGGPQSKWYVVLGVRENASVQEVRTAYKKLLQEYHPDKVANLGKDLRDLAELKTNRITQAFREFERARQK